MRRCHWTDYSSLTSLKMTLHNKIRNFLLHKFANKTDNSPCANWQMASASPDFYAFVTGLLCMTMQQNFWERPPLADCSGSVGTFISHNEVISKNSTVRSVCPVVKAGSCEQQACSQGLECADSLLDWSVYNCVICMCAGSPMLSVGDHLHTTLFSFKVARAVNLFQ